MSEHHTFKTSPIELSQKDALAVFTSVILCRWLNKFVLAIFYFSFVSYLVFIKSGTPFKDAIIPILLGFVALFVFVYAIDFLIIFFQARKLKNSPLFTTVVSVHSTENGFASDSKRGQMEYNWTDFKNYREIKNHFYLRTYEGMLLIFPKRSFDKENIDTFGKALQENIKK